MIAEDATILHPPRDGEICLGCLKPYEKQDDDGGRCTACGRMIVAGENSFRVQYAVLWKEETWSGREEPVPEDLHPEIRGDYCRIVDFLSDRVARETLGEGVVGIHIFYVPPLEEAPHDDAA